MAPVLVGYFPKRSDLPPGWNGPPIVTELCSVSHCLAPGPPGWLDAWRHNEIGFFDSPATAASLIPTTDRTAFHVFGYRLYRFRWVRGLEEPYTPPPVEPVPLPESYERLGVDVVSRMGGFTFECSPLSCNYLAASCSVNRYCLFDTEEEAKDLAARVEAAGAEPGPYYLFEVWRGRKTGPA